MKIITEVMARKKALEIELRFLNDVLTLCQSKLEKIDGNLSVVAACSAGIISVRVCNVMLNTMMESYEQRHIITLRQMVDAFFSDERLFMHSPNFGRKSANEIRMLALRLT